MSRIVPKMVCLPGGYCIEVVRLSEQKANEEMGNGVYALWDVEERQIILRSERKGQDLRSDFCHELEHAMIDFKDWFLGKSEVET